MQSLQRVRALPFSFPYHQPSSGIHDFSVSLVLPGWPNVSRGKLQAILECLLGSGEFLGMHFAPSKCADLFHDWNSSKLNLVLARRESDEPFKSCHLSDYISSGDRMSDELPLRRTLLTFINWRHLWRQRCSQLILHMIEVGSAMRLRIMSVENRGCAKTPGV